jgi:hypothetical protein
MKALVKNGVIEKYPYNFTDLRRDNRQVSFPKDPSDERLAELGLVPVTPTERPAHDPLHERLQDSAAVEGDAVVQVWTAIRRDDIPTVEDFAAEKITQIKTACGEAILIRLPVHRQLNFQRRAIELLDIRRERELTQAEAAERDALTAERDWLEAMRAESNRLEDAVNAVVAGDDSDDEKRTAIAALTFVAVP